MIGRDITALLEHGACAVCGEPSPLSKVVPWLESHVKRHLADGGAVTVSDEWRSGERKRRTCVVPTSSIPDEKVKRPKSEVVIAPQTAREAYAAKVKALTLPAGKKRWVP